MYTPHDYCELPSDINTKIWRYIDFGKFIDLLETQSLFFCRIDKLGDQNEGILPKSTIDFWIDRVRRGLESGQSEVDLKKHISFLHTEIRRIAMVNCWHISEHENPAMWQIYAKNHFGIAIETTIKDLIDTFKLIPDKIFIGKINYCRLEDPRLNIGNTLINIFNKS